MELKVVKINFVRQSYICAGKHESCVNKERLRLLCEPTVRDLRLHCPSATLSAGQITADPGLMTVSLTRRFKTTPDSHLGSASETSPPCVLMFLILLRMLHSPFAGAVLMLALLLFVGSALAEQAVLMDVPKTGTMRIILTVFALYIEKVVTLK